jgi:Arc/MetJ family transcription regulator
MEPTPGSGARLLAFVRERMTMSSYYQPLVIRSLIEANGRLPAEDLAKLLLVEDRFAVAKALRTLMRWPRTTLQKHGIVEYDRASREFVLLASLTNEDERGAVLSACTAAIANWQQRQAPKIASRNFRVIESAGGRCEACGVPASIRPIDVDHVVPRSHAAKGIVTLSDGSRVPVDDERNLQALCSRCNRGKRDASTFDFRPSPERLSETISLVLQHGCDLGYDIDELLLRATVPYQREDRPATAPEGGGTNVASNSAPTDTKGEETPC